MNERKKANKIKSNIILFLDNISNPKWIIVFVIFFIIMFLLRLPRLAVAAAILFQGMMILNMILIAFKNKKYWYISVFIFLLSTIPFIMIFKILIQLYYLF